MSSLLIPQCVFWPSFKIVPAGLNSLGVHPSDWVHKVESVDNYLMCTYVVYSSVHLSVSGPVIWVHFRSRANTPRNDGMEGDHILSFNYREVALSRQMLGRNYAKNPRVPFRTSSPVALEWWNEWWNEWYLADDFQFVLLMSVSAFSQLCAIIIHLYKLITILKREIWVLFVVIPIYFAFEQHVPEDQGFVSSCSSITKTVR